MTHGYKGQKEKNNYLSSGVGTGRPVCLEDAVVHLQVSIRQSGEDCSIHQITFPSLTYHLVGYVKSYGEWNICRKNVSHFSALLRKTSRV